MGSHFGCTLRSYILYQYYHALVTQSLILEQLLEIGIDISSGEINRVITEDKERFHDEKEEILRVGGFRFQNTSMSMTQVPGITVKMVIVRILETNFLPVLKVPTAKAASIF